MAQKESVFDHYRAKASGAVHRFAKEVSDEASNLKKKASDTVETVKEAVGTVSGTTAARAIKKATGGR